MSYLLQVEQSARPAEAATQQTIYPIAGGYARMDSTGVQKVILDSATYAAVAGALIVQANYLGL